VSTAESRVAIGFGPAGLAAALLVVALAYSNALGGGFVWDDHHLIEDAAPVQELRAPWDYFAVRRAGLALAREVERRNTLATTRWWKEERHGVFLDYNQNARDKSVASAYSVRSTGWVSTPFRWDELGSVQPADYDLESFRQRWAEVGDLTEGIDEAVGRIEPLLEMVEADEALGLGDAPWPPHYPKQPGEPPRVQPSRQRRPDDEY